MSKGSTLPGKSSQDGPSLEALLGFVAISKVQHGDQVLTQLCLQTLVVFPEERVTTPQQLASLLTAYFDLTVTPHRVERALDRLVSQNQVRRLPESGNYVPLTAVRDRIRERIAAARTLQDRVKSRWINQCKTKYGTDFDGESAWKCLQKYLTALFRRHGLQTVSLLDVRRGPAKDAQPILKASLDDLLDQLECGEAERKTFENAIRLFLSEVGADADRRMFVVQLADGAFSFYSLSAPPEVSARLQSKLEELTLFLDTNFLFGILGLHVLVAMTASRFLECQSAGARLAISSK
jgi:hypothetical protein